MKYTVSKKSDSGANTFVVGSFKELTGLLERLDLEKSAYSITIERGSLVLTPSEFLEYASKRCTLFRESDLIDLFEKNLEDTLDSIPSWIEDLLPSSSYPYSDLFSLLDCEDVLENKMKSWEKDQLDSGGMAKLIFSDILMFSDVCRYYTGSSLDDILKKAETFGLSVSVQESPKAYVISRKGEV